MSDNYITITKDQFVRIKNRYINALHENQNTEKKQTEHIMSLDYDYDSIVMIEKYYLNTSHINLLKELEG